MTKDEGMTKAKFDEAFWNDDATAVVRQELSAKRVYNLEELT